MDRPRAHRTTLWSLFALGLACCETPTEERSFAEPPPFESRRARILETVRLADGGELWGWAQATTPGAVLLVSAESVVLWELHPNLQPQLAGWLNRPIQSASEIMALREAINLATYHTPIDDLAPAIWILPAPSARAEQIGWLIDSIAPPFYRYEALLWRTTNGALTGTFVTDDQTHGSLAGAMRRLLSPGHPMDVLYGGRVYDCRALPETTSEIAQGEQNVTCSLLSDADLRRPLTSVGVCVSPEQSWESIVPLLSAHNSHITELTLLTSCEDPQTGAASSLFTMAPEPR